MAPFRMSTLLSDLDGNPGPGKDGDLVDQIFKEMNGGGGGGGGGMPAMPPQAPPPPSPANFPSNPGVLSAPSSPTAMAAHAMDAGPATAHMIGGSHPTAADFAGVIGGGSAYAAAPTAATARPTFPVSGGGGSRRTITQKFAEEFKLPILVALLVFIVSLPVVNILFAHYLPSMVLPTGQLTTIGLMIKSLGAGAAFWVLQRIIVPLLSL